MVTYTVRFSLLSLLTKFWCLEVSASSSKLSFLRQLLRVYLDIEISGAAQWRTVLWQSVRASFRSAARIANSSYSSRCATTSANNTHTMVYTQLSSPIVYIGGHREGKRTAQKKSIAKHRRAAEDDRSVKAAICTVR